MIEKQTSGSSFLPRIPVGVPSPLGISISAIRYPVVCSGSNDPIQRGVIHGRLSLLFFVVSVKRGGNRIGNRGPGYERRRGDRAPETACGRRCRRSTRRAVLSQSRNIPEGGRAISEIPGDLGEMKLGPGKGTSGMVMKPAAAAAGW